MLRVGFKLFLGVVIGLVMRKPLRGKINRFWFVVIGINNYLCNQKSDILCVRIYFFLSFLEEKFGIKL